MMSQNIKDLFNSVWVSGRVTEARAYLTSNAEVMTRKVRTVARPYTDLAQENVGTAKTFVNDKVKEVRSADSLTAVVEIMVGIVMTVLRVLMAAFAAVRQFAAQCAASRFACARSKMGSVLDGVASRAAELPNMPVVKKVEGVSKKVLGASRHEQAVDFIKANLVSRVYEKLVPAVKSPSGSSTADLTTEGGSVAASSPRDDRAHKQKPRRK